MSVRREKGIKGKGEEMDGFVLVWYPPLGAIRNPKHEIRDKLKI
jgi:hypothetical protein